MQGPFKKQVMKEWNWGWNASIKNFVASSFYKSDDKVML